MLLNHISKIHFDFFDSIRSLYISISRVCFVFYGVHYFSNFWNFYQNFSVFRSLAFLDIFKNMRAIKFLFCILLEGDLGIIMWSFRVLAQIRNLSDDSKVENLHKKFFFKQKTAYEMLRSLVGSEMCIRDRPKSPSNKMQKRNLIALIFLKISRNAKERKTEKFW